MKKYKIKTIFKEGDIVRFSNSTVQDILDTCSVNSFETPPTEATGRIIGIETNDYYSGHFYYIVEWSSQEYQDLYFDASFRESELQLDFHVRYGGNVIFLRLI